MKKFSIRFMNKAMGFVFIAGLIFMMIIRSIFAILLFLEENKLYRSLSREISVYFSVFIVCFIIFKRWKTERYFEVLIGTLLLALLISCCDFKIIKFLIDCALLIAIVSFAYLLSLKLPSLFFGIGISLSLIIFLTVTLFIKREDIKDIFKYAISAPSKQSVLVLKLKVKKILKEDIKKDPYNCVFIYNKALFHIKYHEYDLALKDLEESLRNNQRFIPAYKARAKLNFRIGNYKDSMIDYKMAAFFGDEESKNIIKKSNNFLKK